VQLLAVAAEIAVITGCVVPRDAGIHASVKKRQVSNGVLKCFGFDFAFRDLLEDRLILYLGDYPFVILDDVKF
jgi:hypothetical protein